MQIFRWIMMAMLLSACQAQNNNSLEAKVSRFFLGADLNKDYRTLADYFANHTSLVEKETTGWTMYPPLSALPQHAIGNEKTFYWEEYPWVDGQNSRGEISISPYVVSADTVAKIEVNVLYKSGENARKAYFKIIDELKVDHSASEPQVVNGLSVINIKKIVGRYECIQISMQAVDDIPGTLLTLRLLPAP